MDLNQIVIQRQGFTIFDLLSDIGGIQSLLISGLAYIMSISNYNMFDNFMVSRLYKLENASSNTRHIKNKFEQSTYMKSNNLTNPKDYFIDLIRTNFKCCAKRCKKDRLEAGFEKARA